MRHAIKFGGGPQDVTVTTHGHADPVGFVQVNEQLVSDPRFRPGMLLLIDHSDLDLRQLSGADLEAIAYCAVRLSDRLGSSTAAIVAPSALSVELNRMSDTLSQSEMLRLETFETQTEALAWLARVRVPAATS